MKNFIKLLAAAAPLALSINASAETFTVGTATAGNTYSYNFSAADFLDTVDNVFIDHVVFDLASAATVTFNATSSATAVLLNSGDPLYNFISADFVSPLSLTASLAAGSYQFDIKSSTGVFTGALSVAAVPEPETYAMLLAGLGLIGFSARRRQA
jgi:hypothetical protein